MFVAAVPEVPAAVPFAFSAVVERGAAVVEPAPVVVAEETAGVSGTEAEAGVELVEVNKDLEAS